MKNSTKKTIALWMYRNDGGQDILENLTQRLKKENANVIADFDMRECYCADGRVYTKDGFDLSSVDLFYYMNADEQSPYQLMILRALELSGVEIINSWDSFSIARNKFFTNTLLKNHGIDVPPSIFLAPKQVPLMADQIFQKWKKILVKPTDRHGGKGILLFDDPEQLKDFAETTSDCFESLYIEKFIPFEKNDYRIEIIDGKIVGKYSRSLHTHSYKTNATLGGHYLKEQPPKEFEDIALKVAKILDIQTTIIDMLRSVEDQKIYVIEANYLLGVFTEVYVKHSQKLKDQEIFPSIQYDNKKLDTLIELLLNKSA